MNNLAGNRAHYREIFNLYARQGKITKEKLNDLFRLVQLNPTPEEKERYFNIVFENRQSATFDDFLKLFRLKCSTTEYTSDEIYKGFLMMSDSDRKLHVSKIEELIDEHTEDPQEKVFLMDHVRHYVDEHGYVDYTQFVNNSF